MPSDGERRGLLLITGVLLLGMGVRARDALRPSPQASPVELRALDAQIARVDSARRGLRGAAKQVARSGSGSRSPLRTRAPNTAVPNALVDLDVAGADEIERLPWVGPVLAQRIVANRDSCGAFGSLEALQRVYGIGARLAARLEEYVTFSGAPRPHSAAPGPDCQRAAERPITARRGRS